MLSQMTSFACYQKRNLVLLQDRTVQPRVAGDGPDTLVAKTANS